MWILEPFKSQSESWKSPGNLFLKKGMNPVNKSQLWVILLKKISPNVCHISLVFLCQLIFESETVLVLLSHRAVNWLFATSCICFTFSIIISSLSHPEFLILSTVYLILAAWSWWTTWMRWEIMKSLILLELWPYQSLGTAWSHVCRLKNQSTVFSSISTWQGTLWICCIGNL